MENIKAYVYSNMKYELRAFITYFIIIYMELLLLYAAMLYSECVIQFLMNLTTTIHFWLLQFVSQSVSSSSNAKKTLKSNPN